MLFYPAALPLSSKTGQLAKAVHVLQAREIAVNEKGLTVRSWPG